MNKAIKEFSEHYTLESLILAEQKIELAESDITVSRVMKKTGWNEYRVRKIISDWERDGKIELLGQRREPLRGAIVKAWKIKEQ